MKIRIAIATYGQQEKIVNSLQPGSLPDDVELIKMNLALSELVATAKQLERERAVDAFIASGGNAATLKQIITTLPIIIIEPTGLDMINTLREVSLRTSRVAIIFYAGTMGEAVNTLYSLKDIIDMELNIFFYSTLKELDGIIQNIVSIGLTDVIGGSLAIQVAAENGLYGHYILTEAGLVSAIQNTTALVRTRYEETIKSRQLTSVLNSIKEGIIATNREDIITICNPSAERILGIKSSDVVGRKVDSVLPNTRLNIVRETGIRELNQIQTEGSVRILTNRIPIVDDSVAIGALATFYDVYEIENAEAHIRHNLYSKGFIAKHHFNDIIGSSPEFQKVIRQAKEFSKSDTTVLITGESGTGKEMFAQSIHNYSLRKDKPFVAVNCAAMSSQLLESELFGYEEGSFTGAKKGGKRGVFELADTGTVFLDEIAEMSLETQAHLLRVIEQKEVMRVGGEKILTVDIRIIAGTNKDLGQMVREGSFRKDLYYRLNVLRIKLPPLRERRSDIPELAYHFLHSFCPEIDEKELRYISSHHDLMEYDWPGNIRELRNFAERFSVLCSTNNNYDELVTDFFNSSVNLVPPGYVSSVHGYDSGSILSAENILSVLKKCGGNKTKAASLLGISRSTLWRKMKEAGIE
jgi:propionate catabolism operon transcriptional regulator